MISRRKIIHENYHLDRKLQKRIIDTHDFTYFNFLKIIAPYLLKTRKVLDIGCGVGTLSLYFAEKGKDVLGVDISKKAIEMAKMNAYNLKVSKKVKFKVVDFPDNYISSKFDLVLVSEVLEHIRDDKLAVWRIYKTLEVGGILVASSPSKNAPLFRIGLLTEFDKEVGHLRRYDESSFKNLFTKSGFKILKVYKTEGVIRNLLFTNKVLGKFIRYLKWGLSDIVNFADRLTIPVFGESQIYIVAKKI